jgi:hypothetical protein
MGAILGTLIDLIHSTVMAVWVLGLPLLFFHRWPRLTRAYALFAIMFIVLNQASYYLLGECFLTTLARACWQRSAVPVSREWFTERIAQAVFRMTPPHRLVKLVSEVLVLVTAIGVVVSMRHLPRIHFSSKAGQATSR